MSHVHLPVIEVRSSLRTDGTRNWVHPADVSGRFNTARRAGFWALIAIWIALPWIKINGNPSLFLDIEHRKFFLFGATFNAQDIWLMFFLLTGVAFGLVYLTALLGRVWCGFACPQTVFMEGVYRPIERLVEGAREARIRRDNGDLSFDKAWRKALKHLLFVVVSVLVAHMFLSYFVSIPKVFEMVRRSPAEHPEAFGWAMGTTIFFYLNFAFFREQLCLIVCPYGRMQSALIDDDSVGIGYDQQRGEPRGKAKQEGAGDCVDCNRCVVVCPVGIDIRNGLQMDCIACSACIDACDDVMDRLHRPRGLVRFDSLNGLRGGKTKLLRPRVYIYTALMLAGMLAFGLALRKHKDFEANILRLPGLPYVVEDRTVRNSFELHLVNKRPGTETYEIRAEDAPGLKFVIANPSVTLESLAQVRVPVFVINDQSAKIGDFPVHLFVHRKGAPDAEAITINAKFVGPWTKPKAPEHDEKKHDHDDEKKHEHESGH